MRRLTSHIGPLPLLLLLGLVLRLAAMLIWQQQFAAGQAFVFGDSDSYWQLARSIAQGEPYQYGSPDAKIFRMPGYPLLLAPLFLIAGGEPPIWAARLLSALCGTAAIAVVYWLGRQLFGGRAALIAAAITAVYPGAIVLSVVVLSEALFVPLMLLQLALWVAAWQADQRPRSLLLAGSAGLVAAAATLVRPSWLMFVPLAVLIGVLYTPRSRHLVISVCVLLGLVVGMLPWWIRNAVVIGHFVPTTLQVGASLYDGLSPQATGASEMSFVERFAEAERVDPSSTEPFEYRLDRRLREAALDWLAENPGRALELSFIKVGRIWNVWPNEAQFRAWPIRVFTLLTYVPLLVLGLYGAWQYRKVGFPAAICWLPAVYITLLHAVFVSSVRYREPAMLPLAVLASAVLSRASPNDD